MSDENRRYEFEYRYDGISYRCLALRRDRHWGHGLEVDIFDYSGAWINKIVFACHPEHTDFDACQAMSTGELIEHAAKILNSGRLNKTLVAARASEMTIYVSFFENRRSRDSR